MNQDLIKNKLTQIQHYLKELEPILAEDSRQIIEDNLKLHTVERLLQVIVDTAIDINTEVITAQKFNAPEDYYSTFIILGENKILPMEFALKIAPAVGLRNLVVHQYGRVDTKQMIDDIKANIGDFVYYLKLINNYINQPKN